MTRKQALHKALERITDETVIAKMNEIIDDMPFTWWSERTIFDAIDQFILDNGRTPKTRDFVKKCLPPHTVIKLRFGLTLKEFLNKYYPENKLCDSKIYSNKNREEWQAVFVEEYCKNKPTSGEEYNKNRAYGRPSWATVARLFNIVKWSEWLDFCAIPPHSKVHQQVATKKTVFAVTRTLSIVKTNEL